VEADIVTTDDENLDFTNNLEATLLFLDFDGVLHPVHSDSSKYLCRLPLLEATLRSAPPVDIVISSTWQEVYTIKALSDRFSPDVGTRIVGGTLAADPDREEETRYDQIRRFLRWKSWTTRSWLALDDAKHEFPERCSQLIHCDAATGYDETAARHLLQRLLRG
jgi:hypothetical protein